MPTYLFHLEKRNGDSACDVTHACFKKETEAKKKSWLGSWTRPGHCRSFYERTAVGELYEPLLSPRLTWRQNVYCSIVSQVWEGVISVLECVEAGDRSIESVLKKPLLENFVGEWWIHPLFFNRSIIFVNANRIFIRRKSVQFNLTKI